MNFITIPLCVLAFAGPAQPSDDGDAPALQRPGDGVVHDSEPEAGEGEPAAEAGAAEGPSEAPAEGPAEDAQPEGAVPLEVVELGASEGPAGEPAPSAGGSSDAEAIEDLDPDGDGKFNEAPEWGPFYEAEPPSDLSYASEPKKKWPIFSVGKGAFCFVEDAECLGALIADADVGVGINSIGGDRGLDVPYTQFRARAGFTVRPLSIAQKRWRAWGVGLVGSWSVGSPSLVAGGDTDDPFADVEETGPLYAWRIAAINQVWLRQKRNAVHVDFTLGAVTSTVLDVPGQFWGTHAELAVGWAGWAALFASADFLDQDTRAVVGVRAHAIPAAPIVLLAILGMVAGGGL